MKRFWIFGTGLATTITLIAPVTAATRSLPDFPQRSDGVQMANLFHVLDVAEDVDDLIDGDIGKIDPIQDFTRDVEDTFDDVSDTIDDFGDNARDTVHDVNRSIDRAVDDVEDWFD